MTPRSNSLAINEFNQASFEIASGGWGKAFEPLFEIILEILIRSWGKGFGKAKWDWEKDWDIILLYFSILSLVMGIYILYQKRKKKRGPEKKSIDDSPARKLP